MNSYLRFERTHHLETGKTEVWGVFSWQSGAILGYIRWFGRWHQYAFTPEPGCVFNPACLDEISARIRDLMTTRKAARA